MNLLFLQAVFALVVSGVLIALGLFMIASIVGYWLRVRSR